jgi:hypothetical protein
MSEQKVKPHSHIEIAIEATKVFLDDGQLDIAELNFLLGLALRDGGIDADERRVLTNIIRRAESMPLDAATQAHIKRVKIEHALG